MDAGQFARFRGSWGRIVIVGKSYVFMEKWRGQLLTAALRDDIEEVKEDARLQQDDRQWFRRRFEDFY